MYIGLHVKYRLLLADCNETGIFWTGFRKILKYQILWKSVLWGAELLRADRRTYRHDEANNIFFAILRKHLKIYGCVCACLSTPLSNICNGCILKCIIYLDNGWGEWSASRSVRLTSGNRAKFLGFPFRIIIIYHNELNICSSYTGCFTTLGHNCRRWFPRSLWWKKFI